MRVINYSLEVLIDTFTEEMVSLDGSMTKNPCRIFIFDENSQYLKRILLDKNKNLAVGRLNYSVTFYEDR